MSFNKLSRFGILSFLILLEILFLYLYRPRYVQATCVVVAPLKWVGWKNYTGTTVHVSSYDLDRIEMSSTEPSLLNTLCASIVAAGLLLCTMLNANSFTFNLVCTSLMTACILLCPMPHTNSSLDNLICTSLVTTKIVSFMFCPTSTISSCLAVTSLNWTLFTSSLLDGSITLFCFSFSFPFLLCAALNVYSFLNSFRLSSWVC